MALTTRPAATRRAASTTYVVTDSDWLRVSRARRGLDIVLGGGLLLLAVPVLGLAAAAIALLDGRPVLFRQWRIGEGGRPFRLLKLRTMRPSPGAEVTTADDPRVTPIGRLLRRLSADELPQLWHVVRGEMTLVGPRPESVALGRRYPAPYRFALRARPGLTGPTQLRFRERSAHPGSGWDTEEWYLQVLVPLRASCDLDFLERPTLGRTLAYLGRTALVVSGLVDDESRVVEELRGLVAAGFAQPAKNEANTD